MSASGSGASGNASGGTESSATGGRAGAAGSASTGGAGAGGSGVAGAGGMMSSTLERAVCLQSQQQLCTDSMERDPVDFANVCVGQGMGKVVPRCPSEDLLGCCFMPANQGLADIHYCFYVGVQSGLDQASCEAVSGIWSKTPPP